MKPKTYTEAEVRRKLYGVISMFQEWIANHDCSKFGGREKCPSCTRLTIRTTAIEHAIVQFGGRPR